MKTLQKVKCLALLGCLIFLPAGISRAGIATTVPLSADLSTSIAGDMFPVTIKLERATLYLTEPKVLFLSRDRIGMRVRFQAYEHNPKQGIAISEMGKAVISGAPGYDTGSREIVLKRPQIDKIAFDRASDVTRDLRSQLRSAWSGQVQDPIRAEVPAHPYTTPIKNNIQDLTYDGKNINIKVAFQ